jgi:hypothetical protein
MGMGPAVLAFALAFALQPPGSFHGGEAVARDGERWWALAVQGERAALVATRVRVRAVHDPLLDGEGRASGEEVLPTDAPGALMLLRGERLRAGPVTQARFAPDADTLARVEPLTLGSAKYRFGLQCGAASSDGSKECAFMLEHAGRRQRVLTLEATTENGALILGQEANPGLVFAGDLDRDGKLDLILDTSDHYNVGRPALFLSSQAREGELVHEVASFSSVGC